LQYTPAGGSVELRVETVDVPQALETVSIRFSVVDTGSGMSATEVLHGTFILTNYFG
jgi:signal transduction histidine kinase